MALNGRVALACAAVFAGTLGGSYAVAQVAGGERSPHPALGERAVPLDARGAEPQLVQPAAPAPLPALARLPRAKPQAEPPSPPENAPASSAPPSEPTQPEPAPLPVPAPAPPAPEPPPIGFDDSG